MEMGDFMEPGQQALDQVEHRGAVKVFGVSSSQGVRASKMGQVVSTAYQEHVVFSVLFFFYHCIKLYVHSIGQDSQAVCVVCHQYYAVFWSACVTFVSPFCQAHSDFLL